MHRKKTCLLVPQEGMSSWEIYSWAARRQVSRPSPEPPPVTSPRLPASIPLSPSLIRYDDLLAGRNSTALVLRGSIEPNQVFGLVGVQIEAKGRSPDNVEQRIGLIFSQAFGYETDGLAERRVSGLRRTHDFSLDVNKRQRARRAS